MCNLTYGYFEDGIDEKTSDFIRLMQVLNYNHNPHGFGILYNNCINVYKNLNGPEFINFGSLIGDKYFMAHTRYASVGSLELKNTHPFIIKSKDSKAYFTLMHNGTLLPKSSVESDSGALAEYMAERFFITHDIRDSLEYGLSKFKAGAYCLLISYITLKNTYRYIIRGKRRNLFVAKFSNNNYMVNTTKWRLEVFAEQYSRHTNTAYNISLLNEGIYLGDSELKRISNIVDIRKIYRFAGKKF